MILFWLLVILVVGGVLAWLAGRLNDALPRWIALVASALELALVVALWVGAPAPIALAPHGAWLAQLQWTWIPRFGISFHLAMDGLSLLLVALTAFLGIVSVLCSWTEIKDGVGFFHFNLLWSLAGVVGVFLALDLFLFFFFWEVMLVPMYFLIAIWGHENRVYSAIKFFIFTQASSLLMLAAILALVFVHESATGRLTFDYFDLLGTTMSSGVGLWLMLGFFVAFAVKLPAVPVHTWLPDAHTDAPTAGSVILAGVLLKTGAYGLIRFVVPLFPQAAASFTPVAMALGVTGIIYGAVLAFAQQDFKRLVAYTSISHLGFVLLGVFAWNELALQGSVMQMLAHGLSTGALFAVAGALQERLHTRDMGRMGGLWASVPRMGAITMFFAIASLGLPGLGNFVGEFLILLGTFAASRLFTVLAALGLITAVVYALILVQRSFHGEPREALRLADFSPREMGYMCAMIVLVAWLGLYPQPVLDLVQPALHGLQATAATALPSAIALK
jgi:NADH-quinone oxidoreductase subunit M